MDDFDWISSARLNLTDSFCEILHRGGTSIFGDCWLRPKIAGDLDQQKVWWFGNLQVEFQFLTKMGPNFVKLMVYTVIWESLHKKQRKKCCWWLRQKKWWFGPPKIGDLVIHYYLWRSVNSKLVFLLFFWLRSSLYSIVITILVCPKVFLAKI